MPSHGDHWETLFSVEDYMQSRFAQDFQEARFIGSTDCMDMHDGTERTERLSCLRWGTKQLAKQFLVASNSGDQSNYLVSAYPVALDGTATEIAISSIEPWQFGIEGWVHGNVRGKASICFFDTMYFAGTAELKENDVVTYQLAGLAYMLRPIQLRSFEVSEGSLWELEKQRRLEAGEPLAEASRPVDVHLTGAAMLLPRSSSGDDRDDAQFQGVINTIDVIEHGDETVYRLELVLMRFDDEDFRLPVYVSERVLDGYVPRLGDDVEGIVWIQGHRVGAASALTDLR